MVRGSRRWQLWVGLVVFGAMVVGEREARASLELSGITITGSGGTVPGTDPVFFYTFDVSIAPGYQMDPGDHFTINGLIGVSPLNFTNPSLPIPGSFSLQPSPFNLPVITITSSQIVQSKVVYTSDVEWINPLTFFGGLVPGSILRGGATGLDLGSFTIFTDDIPSSSIPSHLPLTYSAKSHSTVGDGLFLQQPGGQNSPPPITLDFVAAPEPSTWVFLLSAAAVAPLRILWVWRRRRSVQAA
jgi:hypothetical protein